MQTTSIGIIEPFKDGFLDIIPEGEGSDYWQIAAIHMSGEVFCPSPRIYPSQDVAIAPSAVPFGQSPKRGEFLIGYAIMRWKLVAASATPRN